MLRSPSPFPFGVLSAGAVAGDKDAPPFFVSSEPCTGAISTSMSDIFGKKSLSRRDTDEYVEVSLTSHVTFDR